MLTDYGLEERTTGTQRRHSFAWVCNDAAPVVLLHLGTGVNHQAAFREYVFTESGKQVFDGCPSCLQQDVWVTRLWCSVTAHRVVRERITLDDDDLVESIGQYAGSTEAGHTTTENDGALTHVKQSIWVVSIDCCECHAYTPMRGPSAVTVCIVTPRNSGRTLLVLLSTVIATPLSRGYSHYPSRRPGHLFPALRPETDWEVTHQSDQ
jgi:hypothetical protein